MNNKGFTTVELVLTLAIVMVIMATITSVTYTYRDRSNYEEVVSEIMDYKNTVTKIIYDDILNVKQGEEITKGTVIRVEKINEYNYKLITVTDDYYLLQIINEDGKVGIKYDDVEYIIPGSNNSLVVLDGVSLYPNDDIDSDFYTLDIYFSHKIINKSFKIHLVIQNSVHKA